MFTSFVFFLFVLMWMLLIFRSFCVFMLDCLNQIYACFVAILCFFVFFLWQKIFCNLDIFSLVFEFLSSGLLWVYYKNPLQKNTTPKFIMPSLPKIFWSKKTKKMTQYANLSCLNKFGFEQCMHVDLMDYKQQHWHSNPKIFLD